MGLDEISSILAIRLARVGDVVLLLPALVRLKQAFPDSRLTLLTGTRCAPIGGLCPDIDEVIPVDRLRMRHASRIQAVRSILRLVGDVRARRFDLVVDFHSFRETNLLAWLSGAPYRLGMKRSDRAYLPFCFNLDPALEDKGLHVADMFQKVVERLPRVSAIAFSESEQLVVPPETALRAAHPSGTGPVVAFYVGASVPERRWPAERFAALTSRIAKEWSAWVVVLSGKSDVEEQLARQVVREAKTDPKPRLLAGLDLLELVGAIARADLLVSNDSGPMHIGSALGVPTLGIFSSSLPEHYGPRGARDRHIKGNSMEEIGVDDVLATMGEMRATEPLGRRP